MKFRYQAFDRAGTPRSAVIEAASSADAGDVLRREGLFVTSIEELGRQAGAGSIVAGFARGGVMTRGSRRGGVGSRVRSVAAFSRQMSVLVSTGTRVADALIAMEKQSRDAAFREAVGAVRQRVEEGVPFSEALASQPIYFDSVSVSLVRAGESSGRLDTMLSRLSEITQHQLRVRQAVKGAMAYPCVLIAIAISVLAVMLLFVLPRFTVIFDSMQVPLPATTRALLWLSATIKAWWWAIGAVVGGAGVLGTVWYRTAAGRATVHRAMLWLPAFGRLARSLATARLARLLGLLLESKVPLLEALELTRDASTNVEYRRLLERTGEAVQRGETLSSCLSEGSLVEPGVIEALRNAERTGQIGAVLTSMADFLDEENRTVVKSLSSLVEPLILIALGVVVGVIAISMFLPLFDLTAQAGGGPAGGGP